MEQPARLWYTSAVGGSGNAAMTLPCSSLWESAIRDFRSNKQNEKDRAALYQAL
jgi:hypothetical protein